MVTPKKTKKTKKQYLNRIFDYIIYIDMIFGGLSCYSLSLCGRNQYNNTLPKTFSKRLIIHLKLLTSRISLLCVYSGAVCFVSTVFFFWFKHCCFFFSIYYCYFIFFFLPLSGTLHTRKRKKRKKFRKTHLYLLRVCL